MRLLLVPSSDYLGHPFPQRYNHIFERLADFHEVHVARFKLYRSPARHTRTIVHDLPGQGYGGLAAYYGEYAIPHALELRRIVANERIDVVILSNLSAPFGYMVLRGGSCRNVPVVFDLQDYFPSAARYLTGPDSGVSNLLEYPLESMQSYLLGNSDEVVAASRALSAYASSRTRKNVTYIPNGISDYFLSPPRENIRREELGLVEGSLVLGFVGSVEFWFDFDPIIESVKKLVKLGVPISVLLVGGRLRSNYSESVKKHIVDQGLKSNFFFTGFVDQREVPSFIRLMDICVAPFRTSDKAAFYAGPNKIWEYLSQNKPVFITPISDAFLNRGFLTLVSTADDYVQRILQFVHDATPFLSKTALGQDEARKMTWENSSQLYIQLLESLR